MPLDLSRNPSVLIRALPTFQYEACVSNCETRYGRNPSVLIRALPTVAIRGQVMEYRDGCRNPSVLIRALPTIISSICSPRRS